MARVPYLNPEDLPEADRDVLARPIALMRALAHNPEASRAFGKLGGWIRHKCKLDGRLRELAIIQVGYVARSAYEYSHHVKIGFDFGVTEADIHALAAETAGRDSGLPALDRAVLRAAREMHDDGGMKQATFDELSAALGTSKVIDLAVAIAFYCGVVRLLATLQIDVEPEYQRYLEIEPLPA